MGTMDIRSRNKTCQTTSQTPCDTMETKLFQLLYVYFCVREVCETVTNLAQTLLVTDDIVCEDVVSGPLVVVTLFE